MNYVFLLVLEFFMPTDLDKIGKINAAKTEAKKAYVSGNFKTAIAKYTYLIDSLGVNEEEVMLNLANSYFQLNDTVNTVSTYQSLTQSVNKKIKSVANQQLGVLANRQSKFEEALTYFKQALKADPTNEDARYNYEMVKKKLEDQKKKEEQQNKEPNKDQKQNKDKENKDKKDKDKKEQDKKNKEKQDKEKQDKENKNDKNKDKKDKEQKEKEKKEKEEQDKDKKQKEEQNKNDENKDKKNVPPSVAEKLKQMQMSEEKAKMILEAMKNQEVQYYQQNKRKGTKPKDRTKPDW